MEMQVCEIMSRDVQTIGSAESLFEAAQRMRSSDAGVLPVTAPDGDIVGILTDRDIVVRAVADGADAKATSVGEAMSGDPVTCRPDCPVNAAAETMRDRQIRRLVVTQEHNKNVVGIVSLGDIAVRAEEPELAGAVTEGVCEPC
jgi:CBS domain-containing protein